MATGAELKKLKILNLKYDKSLAIATGKNRFETKWKNRSLPWSGLLGKLSESVTTGETHAEYMKMGKTEQDRIKDIGGFVGGHLKEGRRKSGMVESRQIGRASCRERVCRMV